MFNKVKEAEPMYEVNIFNCNNIRSGCIHIDNGKLNIVYGINGTGKTTISKAISNADDADKIKELQTYYNQDKADVLVTPKFNKILTFDETFVNQVVFKEKEDEVIGNSFEIFIKTPKYDKMKAQLDIHLNELKKLMEQDTEIIKLRDSLTNLCEKFKITSSGNLDRRGAAGSVLRTNNLYNIPSELKNYECFIRNRDTNINWIAWKNQGSKFDIVDKCPFCAENLPPTHRKKQEIFSKTYKKADSQNLKEIVDLLNSLQDYINPDKFNMLMKYIKEDTPEKNIEMVMLKLHGELDLLVDKFNNIINFGNKNIAIADISALDDQVNNMEIPKPFFEYFGGEHIDGIIDRIDDKVEKLKNELAKLKREMGELKGIIQGSINESQKDINDFLKTAGINYELEIDTKDEANTKTILKQCFSDDKSQNPDLIILDDPISSFDSNKEYAILHRMFKRNIGRKDVSLSGITVLLLTHDFEPITDFIVLGKLSSEFATASFIWNENGIIKEKQIDPATDIKLITNESRKIALNNNVNIVSRIVFLRKLCELNNRDGEWGYAYDILSCLIHGRDKMCKKICNDKYADINQEDIDRGTVLIKRYIPEYDYDILKNTVYTEEGIKSLYKDEKNKYFRLQLFRQLREITNKIELEPSDDAWVKFIDEKMVLIGCKDNPVTA